MEASFYSNQGIGGKEMFAHLTRVRGFVTAVDEQELGSFLLGDNRMCFCLCVAGDILTDKRGTSGNTGALYTTVRDGGVIHRDHQ
jgi:hypothetical protein